MNSRVPDRPVSLQEPASAPLFAFDENVFVQYTKPSGRLPFHSTSADIVSPRASLGRRPARTLRLTSSMDSLPTVTLPEEQDVAPELRPYVTRVEQNGIQHISHEYVAMLITNKRHGTTHQPFVLCDCRSAIEFERAHILESLNFANLNELIQHVKDRCTPDTYIITFCEHSFNDGREFARDLRLWDAQTHGEHNLHFRNVFVMADGFNAFEHHHPDLTFSKRLSRSETAPRSTNLVSTIPVRRTYPGPPSVTSLRAVTIPPFN